MEYHLGLESHQWGYWLQAEPHGMGSAEENKNPGKNACYTHLHVGIYFDAGAAPGLQKVGSELERVIDKHLEVCEPAGWDAHDYSDTDYIEDDDGPISVNAQVDNLGSYLAAYMGGYTEDLLDKPIEYIAWGALYWSAARRRTSRSKIGNESIRADRCNQRAESDEAGQKVAHGENIEWNDGRGLDVVCACCGSGWAIDQNRMEEPVSDEELTDAVSTAQGVSADGGAPLQEDDDTELSLRERWPDADAAASSGESLRHAAIREKVRTYIEVHGPHDPLPQVLGQLGIAPEHREFVQDLLDGEAEIPSDSFNDRPMSLTDQWELQAIVDSDGVEHSPGGGGVDTVELHLPRQRLLEKTRLRHDLEKGEKFRCRKCDFSSHNPRQIATCLVDHGITNPQFADYLLKVEDYNENSRDRMERPQPP
jgi:hypothetical protein